MPSDERWKELGTLEDAVVAVVGDHYGRYGRSLELSTDLKRDLHGDDFDFLEVLMTLEELLNCSFRPSPEPQPTRLGDLVGLCRSAVGTGPHRPSDKEATL